MDSEASEAERLARGHPTRKWLGFEPSLPVRARVLSLLLWELSGGLAALILEMQA